MITIKAKKLKNFLEKTCGLMFQGTISPTYFETRFGIHTFFLKEPIDVVILKEDGTVYKIRRNLKPGRVYFWNPKYPRVLELPSNYISRYAIFLGERITLHFTKK